MPVTSRTCEVQAEDRSVVGGRTLAEVAQSGDAMVSTLMASWSEAARSWRPGGRGGEKKCMGFGFERCVEHSAVL